MGPKKAKARPKTGGKPTLPEPLKTRAQALAKYVCEEKFDDNKSKMGRGMGVSQPTVSGWVNGDSSPQLAHLEQLAKLAHLKFADWLAGKEPEPIGR